MAWPNYCSAFPSTSAKIYLLKDSSVRRPRSSIVSCAHLTIVLVIAYPQADVEVRRCFVRARTEEGDEEILTINYYSFMEALFDLAIPELNKALNKFPDKVESIPLRWKKYLAQGESEFAVGHVREDFYGRVGDRSKEVSRSR